jgi:G:T/U-mismatch repair DNA glycosylase
MVYIHPFEPFIPKGATMLIIGSIPPARFCVPTRCLCDTDVDFYYGSKDNAFWDLVGDALGRSFTRTNGPAAIMERKSALEQMGMGITDIVARCKRDNGSAQDKKLCVIERKPLRELLNQHQAIDTLIYTSAFVKTHVGKELDIYHRSTEVLREWLIPLGPRTYRVVVLYSPSRSALRGLGRGGEHRRLDQYIRHFRSKSNNPAHIENN